MLSAFEKDKKIQERVQRIVNNESDVYILSEESEDSSESSDDDEVCGDTYFTTWEVWMMLSEVNIPEFEEETGVQHNLNPHVRPID